MARHSLSPQIQQQLHTDPDYARAPAWLSQRLAGSKTGLGEGLRPEYPQGEAEGYYKGPGVKLSM